MEKVRISASINPNPEHKTDPKIRVLKETAKLGADFNVPQSIEEWIEFLGEEKVTKMCNRAYDLAAQAFLRSYIKSYISAETGEFNPDFDAVNEAADQFRPDVSRRAPADNFGKAAKLINSVSDEELERLMEQAAQRLAARASS